MGIWSRLGRARFRLRKTLRFGPFRWHFTQRGYTGWSIKVWRWTWNPRRGKHTIDTPGPGSIHFTGRRWG